MSKEHTKRKRRMKRRGILNRLIMSCLILFGLSTEVCAEAPVQNNNEGGVYPHSVALISGIENKLDLFFK